MIRKAILLVFVTLLTAGLGACATSGGGAERATAKSHHATRIVVDEARVARVEAAARKRGIIVQWVHKPQKTVPATAE